MIKILGKRDDGVLLVNVGSAQCVALDLARGRVATVGDQDSREAMSPDWHELPRDEANGLRWQVEQALGKATHVDLSLMARA